MTDAQPSSDASDLAVAAVFFDFGGVLIDSPFDAFTRYESANQLPAGFIRSVNTRNPDSNAWARFERSELSFDEFCDEFEAESEAAGGKVDVRTLFGGLTAGLRPKMVNAVVQCRTRFKTGLLTNNFAIPLVDSAHASMLDMFDVVVESAVVGIRKPEPDFYLLACESLDIRADQVVFLDDLGTNLKPARALGMITIKVESEEQAIEELEAVLDMSLR